VGALLQHGGEPADVLLLVDLGYGAGDHDTAAQQLTKLLSHGFSLISGLDEVLSPVYDWSYQATLGAKPEDSRIALMADHERGVAYNGVFLTSSEWFSEEAESQSAAVFIGNFLFLDADPFKPGFIDGRFQILTEAAMATGQVVGAAVGRRATRLK